MRLYLVEPSDRIFVKGYGYLSFARNIGKNIGKNISKNLSVKYSQKLLGRAKQSATNTLTFASKKASQKRAEATRNLIRNKNADKIMKDPKLSQQNNSETVKNEHLKEIPKES